MGDYFKHWLEIGESTDSDKLPKIFFVNWFRKNEKGKFIWPGYGENIRVLKWILERVNGSDNAEKSFIGYLPKPDAIDIDGLDVSIDDVNALLKVDKEKWLHETKEIEHYFQIFDDKLPNGLKNELNGLVERINQTK